ncbi:AMIN-like domain-containing (lipo)protein [Corynebacterium atypicum]|uniref:AMIN-like domain-containing (lipo)protein n=1 Tax=Corynebacterium atypicum TaxID=191610 RepID=UPI00069021B0|nr:hypothetical protein [Corynebacterium atypicum]
MTDTETAAPTTVTRSTQAADSAPSPGLPGASTEPSSHMPERAAGLFIEAVRAGSHPGFDRVVFEFSGSGEPGWHTAYTAAPVQLASGRPVEFPGAVGLNVLIHGVPTPYDRIDDAPIPGRAADAHGAIAGVEHTGIFEADAQYVIGLDHERPYTVKVLDNPTRLVIDIESP